MKNENKYFCLNCGIKTIHNHKFRLKNLLFCFALSCDECGELYYY